MRMGLSMGHELVQRIALVLPMEYTRDLELLSLHKIKNRISSLKDIQPETRTYLTRQLISLNQKYREEGRHNRFCITPAHVEEAIGETYSFLENSAKPLLNLELAVGNQTNLSKLIENSLSKQNSAMKMWFANNYDSLIYDVTGNIPYSVVLEMRKSFFKWAKGQLDVFSSPIGDLITSIAEQQRLDTSLPVEDLWVELGGKLYSDKR